MKFKKLLRRIARFYRGVLIETAEIQHLTVYCCIASKDRSAADWQEVWLAIEALTKQKV
jgi:hypothetical protein